jgi:hypothetical protein
MQEIQQNFDQEVGFIETESFDDADLSNEQHKSRNKFNMDARRKIENLLEEKALRKLLEDEYNF